MHRPLNLKTYFSKEKKTSCNRLNYLIVPDVRLDVITFRTASLDYNAEVPSSVRSKRSYSEGNRGSLLTAVYYHNFDTFSLKFIFGVFKICFYLLSKRAVRMATSNLQVSGEAAFGVGRNGRVKNLSKSIASKTVENVVKLWTVNIFTLKLPVADLYNQAWSLKRRFRTSANVN